MRRFNNLLTLMVAVLGLYILATPWLPQAGFWWRQHHGSKPPLVIANTTPESNQAKETLPKDNTLVIPRLLMQLQIFDGSGPGTLARGIWHRPNTSSPDRGSNTVIVGHRFTYTHPNGPFYFLDRLKTGDDIIVYWHQKKYAYRVSRVFNTKATDVRIEDATDTPILTLYTCTPLWTAKDRLIVQAKPIEVNQ